MPRFDESGSLGRVFPALDDEGKPLDKQECQKALADLSEELRRGIARAGDEGAGGLRLGIERGSQAEGFMDRGLQRVDFEARGFRSVRLTGSSRVEVLLLGSPSPVRCAAASTRC